MFDKLFYYDAWANKKLALQLQNLNSPVKAVRLLAHVIGAQYIWYGRISGNLVNDSLIWPEWSAAELLEQQSAIFAHWQNYLVEFQEYHSMISYKNSKGLPFETSVNDILLHVINHGSYHRGQIAQLLRKVDSTPSSTDYITYTRERD